MSAKIKKAIVTGAAGFIGSALAERLAEKGVKVTAVDIIRPRRLDGVIKYSRADVSARGALKPFLDKETVIFHMASRADVAGSVRLPGEDMRSTFLSTFEILESARAAKCKLILPSTASIFDPANKLPVTEMSYAMPSSPYAAAKLASEAYCKAYWRCYGTDTRVARMFSVYGPGMRRFAVHDIVKKIEADGNNLTVLGDGRQIRDYLYIDDVVDGLILIAEKGVAGEDYNLASGKAVNILALARKIAGIMGRPDIKIKTTGKSFPGDVPQWYADITKIKRIGFRPAICLDEGLRRTIRRLAENDDVKSKKTQISGGKS